MTEASYDRAHELDITAGDLEQYYEFLDKLRQSGVTNMWGAGEYLEAELDLEHDLASKVLGAWMKDFSR